jgi:hypothetical protein
LNEERKVMTINPATEEVLKEYQIISKEQIDDKIKHKMRFKIGKKIQAKELTSFMTLLMS